MNTFATCCGPPPGADTFDSSAIVYADVKPWSGVLHQSAACSMTVGCGSASYTKILLRHEMF